ncbi:MAG TPA: ABC transporter ATP-binding protein [Methanomassiliicoccales archaeon]|nr:ABC transporter ATP-binding protein [Methanomassiliicoccales archaeon]
MPDVSLRGLSKHYGSIKAADNLSLDVRDGEYLCLLGPTGAGKTTALRLVSGLIRPDSGKVFLNGRDVTRLEPEERKAVLLSQTYSLFPQLTVAENILFGPDIKGASEEAKERLLADMLDLVRLTKRPDALPRELSGGMQQRTALARALASGADVLLLDEPLRALDARLRISLRHELRSLAKSLNITTIHVTHDQDEALVMADRIAVIRNGSVLQVGTPGEVFDEPISPFVANFVGQSNFVVGRLVKKGAFSEVRCENDMVIQARGCDCHEGQEVVVGVKVGNTEIIREGEGFFAGRIERVLFEGRNIYLDLDAGPMGPFSAKVPSWRLGKLNVGDTVQIRWSADKANVFPMPDIGLKEELRVE